eukprot:6484904-Amphidinium_carterae.4
MDLPGHWERCDTHGRYTQVALPRSALDQPATTDYIHAVVVALAIPPAQLHAATESSFAGVIGPHKAIQPRMVGARGVPGRAAGEALLVDVSAEVLAELVEVVELPGDAVVTPFTTWRGVDRWPFVADVLEVHRKWVSTGTDTDEIEDTSAGAAPASLEIPPHPAVPKHLAVPTAPPLARTNTSLFAREASGLGLNDAQFEKLLQAVGQAPHRLRADPVVQSSAPCPVAASAAAAAAASRPVPPHRAEGFAGLDNEEEHELEGELTYLAFTPALQVRWRVGPPSRQCMPCC